MWLFYVAVYSGAALMVYNIIRYFLFMKEMKTLGKSSPSKALLYIPGVLLIMFLIGYVLVGIFGDPDLIVAGILLGGSIFVFLLLWIIFKIVNGIRSKMHQAELRYERTEQEVQELSKSSLSYFRVNLTKNTVLALGGMDLYPSDKIGASYEDILSARSPNLITRFSSSDCKSFQRQDLLEYYALGHHQASETLLVKRDDRHAAFVSFQVTMAEEPSTGDVIAFLNEEDYNERMILDTILNRALSYRYDIVCSIIEGSYQLIASGQQEGAAAILPKDQLGSYHDFLDTHLLNRLPESEDKEEVLSKLDLATVAKKLEEKTSYELDVRIVYKEQIFYKRFTFYKVTGDVQFFVLLVQDTTQIHDERAKQNELLSAALEEARKANAAKTMFFANMSHDIRTPMNTIMGFSELAKKSDDVETIHQYLGKVRVASDHLLSLIDDILVMSRIESGKMELDPEENDLRVLFGELYDIFRLQMEEKGLSFSVNCDLAHPHVIVDGFRLNRVLLNLLSNAYKFTSKGEVSVSVNEAECESASHAKYIISVKDTGIGMSEEFVKNVFVAYERERKASESEIQGTGLGMAITKSIVDLMNGDIEVHSKKGEGTEFIVTIQLPYVEKASDALDVEKAEAKSIEHRFDGKRVLIADDNEINLEIAKILLESMGFEVECVDDGKKMCDALFKAPAHYYDVILSDVQMPVMDGLEAARAIRAYDDPAIASTPIIACTAYAFKEDVEEAISSGMNGCITKPIIPEELVSALKSVLPENE